MTDHGKTISAIRPNPVEIDGFSVWVHSNIEPVSRNSDGMEFKGFQYDMLQFDKDEYILAISERTYEAERQLTDAQLALCEMYERMMG